MVDHEMVDIHEHTTMISSGDILESATDVESAGPLNDRKSLELPLEPFEGMEFTSIEDVKNYYVSYAKNKGFSFRMGRVTKSRTNGPSKIASVLSTESGGIAIEDLQESNNRASSTSLFNSIMVESLQVSERGSRSVKHHDVAIQALRKVITELDLLDHEESSEEFVNSTFKVMPDASNKETINLLDPPLAASKGRPRTLRTKDSLELLKKGSFNCGYCKEKGHNRLTCTSLKQRRFNIINGQSSNSNVKGKTTSSMVD
ncbi:hypothetical protein P8452_47597 [Trifolium repens]|nr:hypothetical protein P8452_47597 [Trifolium repens]